MSVCLNSSGGNYDEALKLITILMKGTNVATVIDRGAQCISTCAFLFIVGNTQKSEDGELGPDRTLDVRGTLGFHAPYLKTGAGTDVAAATIENFRRGVAAIAQLLELDLRALSARPSCEGATSRSGASSLRRYHREGGRVVHQA